MTNYTEVPISEAEKIAKKYNYDQVVILSRKVGDGGNEWITTYGINKIHCDAAAKIGSVLVGQVVEPLEKMQKRIKFLEDLVNKYESDD